MESHSSSCPIRNCPVCAGGSSHRFLRKQALTLVECESCGTVYVPEVPASFQGQHYNEIAESLYLSEEKLASDYASVRFERELNLLRRHVRRGRLLDVGCSTGAFLYQVRQRWPEDYEATGTDVCQPALEYARSRGIDVVQESFLQHDFGECRFDAITFWAVLEHLTDPAAFLRRADTLLQPNGFCFILVPNLESLATRLLGAKYRYIFPQHVNYFTRTTLRRLATQPGWKMVEEGSFHFNPVVIWQDWKNKSGEFVPDRDRVALLRKTTACKQSPLLAPLRWAYRASEKCLGAAGLADNIYIVLQKQVS